MTLGIEITLILGELMGDMALPILKKQCRDIGTTPEALTLEQAEQLMPKLEKILRGFYAPGTVDDVIHKMKVAIANERFKQTHKKR